MKVLISNTLFTQKLSSFLNSFHIGSDDDYISCGCRVTVPSRLDSGDMSSEHMDDSAMMICRSESASIPPADFRLYNATGKTLTGNQYAPFRFCPRRVSHAMVQVVVK